MSYLLVLLTTISLTFPLELEAPFGIKFGTQIRELKVKEALKTTAGALMYEVSPPQPEDYFELYVVEPTQKNEVAGIWAVRRGLTKNACLKELEKRTKYFEHTYGLKRRKPPVKLEGYSFEGKRLFVALKCLSDKKGWSFYLQVYDKRFYQ